jgi:hypothetical protein
MSDRAKDRVTPEDIEAKLRVLQDEVEGRATSAKEAAVPFAVLGAVLLLIIAYLLGKRVGRRKSTVVEIRRI